MKHFDISTKYKMLLVITIALSLIIMIAYFIIIPTITDIIQINQKIMNEKEDLEFKYKKGQYLKKVYQDFRESETERKIILNTMAPKDTILSFITEIEKFSENRNLDPKILQPQLPKNAEKDEDAVMLEVHIKGDYIEFLKFLSDLEMMKYYFNISDINISTVESHEGEIQAAITGKIYTYENKKISSP